MKDTYRIQNLKAPSDVDEPATKSYTDNNFLNLDGTNNMTGNLDMDSGSQTTNTISFHRFQVSPRCWNK